MKVLGVLCLAAYAVCVLAGGYLPGKEYVYKYKGKLYTELSEQHHQHAGLAFKSEVHLQPGKDFYLVKITHIVIDKINERVTKEKGYDFQYQENQVLSETLRKPFKIYMEHGLVHHVTLLSDEPVWSVNFKKSLAALFQLNFDQINAVRTDDGKKLVDHDLNAHYFNVMEDSTYGECETMYQVSHEPSHFLPYTIPVLNVTKSTNFGHCTTVPYYRYDNINYDECIKCNRDIHQRLSNVLHFNLRGDRHNFVVEKVHTESEFTHVPFTINGDIIYVHTNRTLLLLEERDVSEEIKIDGKTSLHYDLHFHFPGEHSFKDKVDLKEPHFLYHFLSKSGEVELVGKEFNALLEPILDGTLPEKFKEFEAGLKFGEIVKHVSTLGYDDIEKIYKDYVDVTSGDSAAQLARVQLFFDIVSSTGTNPAFLFAKNHLFEPHVPPSVAVSYIQMLPFTIKEVSETLFDEIYDLCESEQVSSKPHLQNNCYLSFSSLIFEHCVGKSYQYRLKEPSTIGESCTPEVAKKYYQKIVHYFENDHDDLELITGIKATGNFGLKDGIEYLRKYIDDDHYPTYFRVAAIWALRRIATFNPEDVLEEIVPVYFNISEGHEIRIAAFGVIMLSHPSRSVLEAIGVSLHDEHNRQVVSFVSSSLHYFAHSDYPCHRAIKRDIEHVLRHVLRLDTLPDFDFKHSSFWMNAGYNEEYGFAGMSSVSYVTSNDSYLPSTLYVGAKDYLADIQIESVSLIIHQEGLQKFFDRIFGPEGLFKKKKSVFDLLHRRVTRDTASVEKELKEIDDRLHIKTRHEREIHGDISVRMFGHELNFFYFNESLFEDFLHDGYFNVPDFREMLKIPSLTFTKFYVTGFAVVNLPSCIGFPLFLMFQEPSFTYYKNEEFKFDVSPSIFSNDRNNEAPTALSLQAKGHFIRDTVSRGVMGVSLNFDHSTLGVGILRRSYINTPIDVDLNVDLKTWKITLKTHTGKSHGLIHASCHPFTIIDDHANDIDISHEPEYLPYFKSEDKNELSRHYYHDLLGYGFDIKAKYGKMNIFRNANHARKFFAEHSFRDIYYGLLFNPHLTSYEVDIDVTSGSNDQSEELEIVLDFDYFDQRTDNQNHSELYEGYREDMEKYAKNLPGKEFYTYVAQAEFTRKATTEKKVVVLGSYTHSYDQRLQEYQFYYDRSPRTAEETEHFKVCANVFLRYPEYDLKKLHDLDTLDLDQKVEALVKLDFGRDCNEDKKITIHGVLSRSKEQIEEDRKREEVNPLHISPYSVYYHKCKEEQSRGAYYDVNCRKYIYYSTRLHHYDIDVTYDTEMSDHFLNETFKWFSWLDHELYYYLDKDYIVEKKPKKLEFHFNFDPLVDTVDIEILKHYSTAHYHNVPVGSWLAPLSASPFLSYSNKLRFSNYFKPSLCTVEGEYVTTFDNVTYHLPPIDCWKVLAKDCSEHEDFLVLGKKLHNPNYSKAVKVFLGKTKLEILPVTDDSEPIVRVNGKKVDVTETAPYFHESDGDDHGLVFYVTYNGLYYTVSSPKYGVVVYYDGKAIVTELSSYYQGKQCGLCGDFNHERDGDFRGPKDCAYKNVTDFAAAYSIHDIDCRAPGVRLDVCERQHLEEPCTIMRNRYVYVGTNNRQLCFSTVPIAECSPECIETRSVTRNIGFHCLPAKESSTRHLLRLSRERVLHELRGKVKTYFSDETFPESCKHIDV